MADFWGFRQTAPMLPGSVVCAPFSKNQGIPTGPYQAKLEPHG